MSSSKRARTAIAWAICGASLAFAGAVEAQQPTGTVRGRVTAANALRTLTDVQVYVPGTGRGTLTNAEGTFVLQGVPAGVQTLRAELLGFTPVEREITVQAGQTLTVDLELAQAAIGLDEVVVTGVAGGTQRRAIGNVVAQIRADDAVDRALVPSVQGLLNGRAPNVVVMPGTGMVGSGSKIRIRGASSLSLSNEPLIYVDGVRVDNAQSTGPAVQAFGSSVISRLNDFNPDDIESIEIIKGPAAATLYGTEASNGVIQIITKKGRIGSPVFSFTTRQGANWFANYEDRIWTNYWRNPDSGQIESLNLATSERARGTPLFRTGHVQNYSLSVSGGSEASRYYVATDLDREEGVEPSNELSRFSGRANLSIYPHEKVDVTGSVGYISGRTNLSCEAGCGGVTWGSYFSTPQNLNENLPADAPPRRGYRSFTSEVYYESEDFQDLTRFTGSIQLDYRTAPWLTNRLVVGTDEVREDNQSITERSELLRVFSPSATGSKSVSRRDVSSNTVDYSGTVNIDLTPELTSNTAVGAQYYRRLTRFVGATGTEFVLPGLRAVNAAATRTGSESYFENTTVGVFFQEQLGWRDRLFFTAAIRADDNSAFGENFDLVYYPKASLAWVVSEEPFFNLPLLNTLRLRAAYGESGQQPAAFAALRTYGASTGPNDVATVTPLDAGNPDLGPERGKELELGFDASFLQDRIGLEFTYYNTRITDAILTREAPPSQGFPGLQYVNLGELKKDGIEVLLRGTVLERENVAWDATVSFAHNDSEVLDLGGSDRLIADAAFGVEHRQGFPLGSWFHVKVLSAELDANGSHIKESMMCEGETGSPVPCFTGTTVTAPRVYLGRTNPANEGAFSSSVTFWNRIRLYGMVDFKLGHQKWDHNLRVRCSLFNVCHQNVAPLEYDPIDIAAYQNADRFGAAYINDASFAKLREVSATYIVPSTFASRFGLGRASVTVAGRNLHTWTKWSGIEPEAMFLGGARGGFTQLEQNNVPQLTQFVTTIQITF
jgi:TonB-linked SusC/RagA family outer membrane protein